MVFCSVPFHQKLNVGEKNETIFGEDHNNNGNRERKKLGWLSLLSGRNLARTMLRQAEENVSKYMLKISPTTPQAHLDQREKRV